MLRPSVLAVRKESETGSHIFSANQMVDAHNRNDRHILAMLDRCRMLVDQLSRSICALVVGAVALRAGAYAQLEEHSSAPASASQAAPVLDEWNGFTRHTFQLNGRLCYVVDPKSDAPGKPWIWRARFWGHRPEVDLALLAHGYHLVYMDVAELLGNAEAVADWDSFYKLLTETYGLNRKAEMEGMSRGGLYVYAWAEHHPDRVAAIYADAPVCDIKSWPLALRNGKPDPDGWKMVVTAFGFSSLQQAIDYHDNPIDDLAPLAAAHVPLLHVAGDADLVVPLDENTRVLESRYKALGGDIQVIIKHGVGHVHGLDDPSPIINFLLQHEPSH
jgi:pimeloyl-ACP methyl ester carboxylesterase